jgi:lipid-binding SYLF domain-containing protein
MTTSDRTATALRFSERGAVRSIVLVVSVLLVISCSSYRSMSVEEKRALLVELEEKTLVDLVEQHPEAEADLDSAVGYAIFSNKTAKIPFVGAGDGIGVVVNTTKEKRTYLKVGRIDVGGGLGVRTYRLVVIFLAEEALEKMASGKLEFGAGMEASAGSKDVGADSGSVAGERKEKYVLYQLSEAGVSATFTVRMIRYSVLDLEEDAKR